MNTNACSSFKDLIAPSLSGLLICLSFLSISSHENDQIEGQKISPLTLDANFTHFAPTNDPSPPPIRPSSWSYKSQGPNFERVQSVFICHLPVWRSRLELLCFTGFCCLGAKLHKKGWYRGHCRVFRRCGNEACPVRAQALRNNAILRRLLSLLIIADAKQGLPM